MTELCQYPDDHYWESEEDAIGPAHHRPWGCCFGYCDTDFSIAFREYHGLEKAWQAYKARIKADRKHHWKKCERKKPSKYGSKIYMLDFDFRATLGGPKSKCELTPYLLPRYLRLRYFSKRRLKLSQRQIEMYAARREKPHYQAYWEEFPD